MFYPSSPARRGFLITAFAVATLSLCGCQTIDDMLAAAPKPTASIKNVSISRIDLNGLDLAFDVMVTNPYSVDLPVAALDLGLESGGTNFLTAQSQNVATIPAKGSSVVPAKAVVTFASLMNVLAAVKPGNLVPYKAKLGIGVDAPAVGRMTLPLEHEGQIPVPTVPDVKVTDIHWTKLDFTEASAVVKLEVGNTNDFPLDFDSMNYGLSVSGTKFATLASARPASFTPGSKQTLEFPISLKPIDLGMALYGALRASTLDYSLDGALNGKTPFGPIAMPIKKNGKTALTK